MRRYLFLICLAILVSGAGSVYADADMQTYDPLKDLLNSYNDHKNDDGVVTSFNLNDNYINVPGLNRDNWYNDLNGQNTQNTSVNVRLEANIPCYIEMKVTGNKGQTIVQSFGPSASANDGPRSNYWLLFDNEVGGYVNNGWESIGHGKNAEIEPGPGVYIQGCDVFKVEIYANDTYKYQVESGALTTTNADTTSPNASKTLDLQMRTSLDGGAWTAPFHSFGANPVVVLVPSRAACESLVALHQFRVPYDRNIAHGQYTGNVTFRAATI